VIENDQPHTDYNFRTYLSWYLAATGTKFKGQWTGADYADIQSSDDEDVDEEPYRNVRVVDSDDDRLVAALSEEDMERIRFFF
jgi:hypothetical protein